MHRRFCSASAISLCFVVAANSAHAAPLPTMLQSGTIELATSAGEITSVLETLNGGFFNQNNAFTGSAPGTVSNQSGGGVWVRSTGGAFNSTVPGTIQGVNGTIPLHTSSDFTGVQIGADIARYDIGSSGYTLNFGVTGGHVGIESRGYTTSSLSKGAANFDVPFVGAYAAVAGHGFFVDALFREDFIGVSTDPQVLKATLLSSTFAASAGYRYDMGNAFFAVPGAAISITSLEGKSFAVPKSNVTDPGVARLGSVDSDLGRLSLTVGRDFITPQLLLTPFVTGTVFNEFAGSSKLSYTDLAPSSSFISAGQTTTGTVGRVGTFEQFSAGVNTTLRDTGLISYVRGDIRTGDRVDGFSVSGGIRYSF